MFLSSSRGTFKLLKQNSVTDVDDQKSLKKVTEGVFPSIEFQN